MPNDRKIPPMSDHPQWKRVVKALEMAGLSTKTKDVAALCQVQPPSVSGWKRKGPGRKNLNKIANATGVRFEWLETGRGPMLIDPESGSNLESINTLLRDLPDEELKEMVEYAKFVRQRLLGNG